MIFDESVIIFDVETTGLYVNKDEIIQLSIIDGTGNVLFNELIKPSRRKKWDEAERINHISPKMVKKCKTFRFFKKKVQEIFVNAKTLIAYNGQFDIRFLNAVGINVYAENMKEVEEPISEKPNKKYLDVMLDFAEIYGEWSDYHNCYKWQKFVTASHYYGYQFKAHDSLEDVKATLFVAKNIYTENN